MSRNGSGHGTWYIEPTFDGSPFWVKLPVCQILENAVDNPPATKTPGRAYRQFFVHRALWLIDLVCVLLFVGIGRSVHTHGLSIDGMASTAWPFLTGLAIGWIVVGGRRLAGASVISGVLVSTMTVAVGMILRVISGQGTALAFILVALGFLGATMIGWRLVGIGFRRMHRQDSTS